MVARSRAASRKSKSTGETNAPALVPLARGWTALARGHWGAARTAFTGHLEGGESAEALEGLSWAAWWLDDADAVFDARERAYHLYRARGETACAARMATWLAADHLDFHGALAVANGWLRRARRLLQTREPGPDHGWLAFHEGYIAFLQGDVARSSELAACASELGGRFDVPDIEMLGLALEGAVLVASGRVRDGMHRLDEATTAALEDSEARIPISRAWTCCFLVTACEAVRDFRRAFEWCDRIAVFADRYGSRYMLGFCRQHYAAVHMWRGQWQEAEAQFHAAIDAYTQSRPAFVGGVLAGLAELRRRQGRWKDAEQLLHRAAGGAALVCRSRLARDRGDAPRALALAERALRQTPEHITVQRAPALEALIAAAADAGDLPRAHAALAELRALARVVDTAPLRASVDLAGGVVAATAGDQEQARRLLEDAVDGFERSGAPFETAEARLELSKCLSASGRALEGAEEARHALERLRALGVHAEEHPYPRGAGDAVRATPPPPPVSGISRRERDVLRCVTEGLTNRQIAERLFVSEHTVHRHISSILRKLDLPTRTAAAAHALRAGLLGSPDT